ncbi:MAG: zinc ABC transporter substrate-binding protein [Rhodobacteraceae bacterium]|nr:zinc ABC transporter substrate-binding protein [Paracoccaceae bacterium]
MLRPTAFALTLAALPAALVAAPPAAADDAAPAAGDVPSVVTDIAPVHSLVAQVMGDLGAPVLLLDRGADPHSFQLRPSQAAALAGADLVFWIGPELTPWLDRALAGSGAADRAVPLLRAEGVTLRDYATHEAGGAADHAQDSQAHDGQAHDDHGHDDHAHGEAAHDGHGHAHAGTDPHAWLDPANAIAFTRVIEARLAAADPANAAAYAANAEAARADLAALDAELRETLAPARGVPLVMFHDAYGYLAAAYGLTVAGTLAEGDAAAPGAQRLAALRASLAGDETACLFAEANHDPALVETLAADTGRAAGMLDPDGAGFEPGPALYGEMMRALAAAIAACAATAG